jgi:hypothetical protein
MRASPEWAIHMAPNIYLTCATTTLVPQDIVPQIGRISQFIDRFYTNWKV